MLKTNAISLLTGGRGFPDRNRPPGDRYQDSPRDRGAPWDVERRRERDHPRDSRDRSRPHEEPRDKDRRPRGELSPGRGPRHWEERRGGECLYHCFHLGGLFVDYCLRIGWVLQFFNHSEDSANIHEEFEVLPARPPEVPLFQNEA